MIFVTVGTANQGFPRLLQTVDALAGEGIFGSEQVFMQIGNTHMSARAAEIQDFLTRDVFEAKAREARLIIAHGGCTVLQLVRMGKLPVVMPRQRKYGEHINDHQVAFVRALAKAGHLIPAYEVQELPAALEKAAHGIVKPLPESHIRSLVAHALQELAHK